MVEPWVATVLSGLVTLLFATLWALDVHEYLVRRDARSLREAIASGMLVVATLGILALSLQRAGVITFDARVWLVYLTRGALLVGGALLLSVRIREP